MQSSPTEWKKWKTISDVEDIIEETDISVKENVQCKKILTQNIQEIWDTMKRQNLGIIETKDSESQF